MYKVKYVSNNVFSQKEFEGNSYYDVLGALLHWTAKDMFSNLPFDDIARLTHDIIGGMDYVGAYADPDHTEVKFDNPAFWVRIDIQYWETGE